MIKTAALWFSSLAEFKKVIGVACIILLIDARQTRGSKDQLAKKVGLLCQDILTMCDRSSHIYICSTTQVQIQKVQIDIFELKK